MPYFYLKKSPPTEESIKLPLFCRTKRNSEPKLPYFYLKKNPPTEESIKLPLFCRTKRTSERWHMVPKRFTQL